jgi:hypothetical protein
VPIFILERVRRHLSRLGTFRRSASGSGIASTISNGNAAMALTVITGIGACLGFYGRSKGVPCTTHFHTDEHSPSSARNRCVQRMHKAALSPKLIVSGTASDVSRQHRPKHS